MPLSMIARGRNPGPDGESASFVIVIAYIIHQLNPEGPRLAEGHPKWVCILRILVEAVLRATRRPRNLHL